MKRAAMLIALALPCSAALADVATAERQVLAQQLDAAEATLQAHLAGQPDDTAAQFLLARVLSWQGRPEQALPIYRRLLQQQPDNADYLLGEGQALLWAGHPQRAQIGRATCRERVGRNVLLSMVAESLKKKK